MHRFSALLLALLFILPTFDFSSAQDKPAKSEARISADDQKQSSQEELDQLDKLLKLAKDRTARLEAEISTLDQDRAAISRALIAAAKRSVELENSITDHETKLASLEEGRDKIRASLHRKRGVLAQVLGALERMGRNPPPAILVTPQDALVSVRSSILLASVVPDIQTEAKDLVGELRALASIGRRIKTRRNALSNDLAALAEDEERLTLLIESKTKLASQSRENLLAEQKRAETLARQATSLKQLIDQLETQIASANKAALAAKQADEKRRREEAERLEQARESIRNGATPERLEPLAGDGERSRKLANTSRTEPAIPFDEIKGHLPLPAAGEFILTFGQKATDGTLSKSAALATRPNARVRSPADGWIVYAGPFRSYGDLVIINVGGNYHVVLYGLDRAHVTPGQFVLTGEPIGKMGAKQIASVGAVDLSSAQPVLYVEFRKDGTSIDPAPWWATEDKKRQSNDS